MKQLNKDNSQETVSVTPKIAFNLIFRVIQILGALAIVLVVLWLLWETYKANNLGFNGKSLWNWMELLVVPFLLSLLAFLFTKSQKETELRIAQRRRDEDIKLAERKAELEREIEKDRQQQKSFEDYLDSMTDLLLNKGLRKSSETDEVRSIARARTLTILRRLDKDRKSQLIQFLYESSLIGKLTEESSIDPIIDLSFAELSNVDLQYGKLDGISLQKSNLRNSNFYGASLIGANFYLCDLDDANLSWTKLMGANLHAGLKGANLAVARLEKANLQRADLSRATLVNAKMMGANLRFANFKYKNQFGWRGDGIELASLALADLTDADLTGAKIDIRQLRGISSLSGAIMPNGQKFEIWKQTHNLSDEIDLLEEELNDAEDAFDDTVDE